MTSPHMPPRRAREHKTAPLAPEPRPDVREDRPTSTKPVDSRWATENVPCTACGQVGLHACNGEQRRLRNLAESHAHEAHRLADHTPHADLTHALLAHVYTELARMEQT